jgi:hypothetical protein
VLRIDFVDEAVRDDRSRRHLGHVDLVVRVAVAVLQQQPLVSLAPLAALDLHERPLAEHLLAVHPKRQLAALERLHRIVARLDELPRPVVR